MLKEVGKLGMTKNKKTSKEIIQRTEETLETSKFGMELMQKGSPENRFVGLRNFVVFGRAVTNVLQNLRGIENDFDNWYEPYVIEMESDPLMKFFYNIRSKILKEGSLQVATRVHIRKWTPETSHLIGPPPPRAKSFFMGDKYGGSGWIVELPDGTEEKYYIELPREIGEADIYFRNPPQDHLGNRLEDKSLIEMCKLYLKYLQKMVDDAKKKFVK